MEDMNRSDGVLPESGANEAGEIAGADKKVKRPRAWVAGLLAVVMPGLGHLYLGFPVLAIAIWLGGVVVGNLIWVAALHPWWGWVSIALFSLVAIVYWAWQVVYAVMRSRRMERRLFVVPWYMIVVVIALWIWGSTGLVPVFGDYQTFKTTASAMQNTLMVGDHFTVDLNAYRSAPVQRDDIIVFLFPGDHETKYVKRCIGLPGDTIEIVNKVVYINGQEEQAPSTVCHIDRNIAKAAMAGLNSRDNFRPYVVPEGEYFVLGDNRDNSSDSRFWGCVPKEDVMGKVMSIYWSGDLGRVGKKVE